MVLTAIYAAVWVQTPIETVYLGDHLEPAVPDGNGGLSASGVSVSFGVVRWRR